MFSLEEALSQWKKNFLQQSLLAPDVVEEIEDYLREEFLIHQEKGIPDITVFRTSLEKLGQSNEMIIEYNKLEKTVAYRFTFLYLFRQWYDYFFKYPKITTSLILSLILIAISLHVIFDYSLLTLPMLVLGHIILLIYFILLSTFAIAPFFLQEDTFFYCFFIKKHFRYVFKFLLIHAIFVFICFVGLIFLIIPGLYLYFLFFAVRWLMVDQNISLSKAIKLNLRCVALFKSKLIVWTLLKSTMYYLMFIFLFRALHGVSFQWVYATVFYILILTINRVFYQSLYQGYALKEIV